MSIISFRFFILFIFSLIVYYMLPQRARWIGLLAYSICFYMLSANRWTIVYLLVDALAVWLSARGIERARHANNGGRAAWALALGLFVVLGILAVLKYNGFIIQNLRRVFHVQLSEPDWTAPMGISFYALSSAGYLLSVFRGSAMSEKNPAKIALLVGYYPTLTSGPILRYETMGGLFEGRSFDYRSVTFGLQRMLWGLFLKLVVSERLGIAVDAVYGDPETYSGLFVWLAAGLFVLQLYTDFSGCMHIVLGASECYGVILPENFRAPLFSRTVQEFWRRWHMTLGEFFRDFVYIPLGGNRRGTARRIFNMLVVWALTGLWHGGSWRFVIWGLWFWACMTLGRLLEPALKKASSLLRIDTGCFSWHLFQSVRTFALVSIGMMFFRLDGVVGTLRMMKQGFRFNGIELIQGLPGLFGERYDYDFVIVGLLVLLIVSLIQGKKSVRQWLAEQNLVFRWILLLLLLIAVVLLGHYGPGFDAKEFIYEIF